MTDADAAKSIARSDYRPSRYLISKVDLTFDLFDDYARVYSTLKVKANSETSEPAGDFDLDGVDLKLIEVRCDNVLLQSGADYTLGADKLTIHKLPDQCVVKIETEIYPAKNTVLEGLYQSSGNFCTQCEAEGFRRISYYPDRPDVMACFDVRIIADKKYPVLLSNGNQTGSGETDDDRHWVQWSDPHPKPCYLFALVAGDLGFIEDKFITAGGRSVELRIYVEHHNIDKCDHAMASLKKAMRWDENVYGLQYDLDIYMIVAVDDFNMGAMENKGLNIFNSKYVLADQATATDADFLAVEAVIAHEYFHNWTGNRVTCRDWFQLSLKEGLTVFRDQEFSADMNSKAVKRIEDVRLLRARQFPEDAGPMAHPIRPDSYIEINNFYTVTVYEKGAEVIRMMRTLMGQDHFKRGVDLYFERHDGQAVTCEDFIKSMEAASGVDLEQFRNWYSQAGTPVLDATGHYDEVLQQFRLTLSQSCPDTPGQTDKKPHHLPCTLSLLAPDGTPYPLNLGESATTGPAEIAVDIRELKQEFVFHQIAQRPVPSMLRGFSAPVILNYQHSNEDLAFLLANDSDSFNRWEAGQTLASRRIEQIADGAATNNDALDNLIYDGFEAFITDNTVDKALRAIALQLPSIETIADRHAQFDIDALDMAYKAWRQKWVTALEPALKGCLIDPDLSGEEFLLDAKAMGQRALHNRCLGLLSSNNDPSWSEFAYRQFATASNMTDQLAALASLVNGGSDYSDTVLEDFYQQWKSEKLVIDKWFSIQAMADIPDTIGNIRALLSHPDFDLSNPNRVRSLIGVFAMNNPVRFHSVDGSGYQLLTDTVTELDNINPQVAARLASPLLRWRRFDDGRQQLQRRCLERISTKTDLSKDVYEIVSRALD